jgi:hypothetical protein
MRYLSEVKLAEVIGAWLRREYVKAKDLGFASGCFDESLVWDDDYDDRSKNRARFEFLYRYRAPIMDVMLQASTRWRLVALERSDLGLLRVIEDPHGWSLLSGGEMSVDAAARGYLRFMGGGGEKPALPDGSGPYFEALLRRIGEVRASLDGPGCDLCLVLLGGCVGGPYVILEGNHTALALYLKHFVEEPEAPYPRHLAYVGVPSPISGRLLGVPGEPSSRRMLSRVYETLPEPIRRAACRLNRLLAVRRATI